MSTTQTRSLAQMSHGHLALEANPVDDTVVVNGILPDYYALLSIHLNATAARALAEQLVAAADAVEGHWQPDAAAEQRADAEPLLESRHG